MKLKTLLMGSAAAMIAVSGARAADAIVAPEPEPVEYVRVCDMYGAGFFYIPGTETCLRITGEVRADYYFIDSDSAAVDDTDNFEYRIRLNFSARNETDYGTLESRIRLEGGASDAAGGGDANVDVDRATIGLAGFLIGKDDDFNSRFHNFGYPVDRDGGFYGFGETVFLEYSYEANGFTATIGVADAVGTDRAPTATPVTTAGVTPPALVPNPTINPEYYVGLGYTGSWGTIAASYIHETRGVPGGVRAVTTAPAASDVGTWKVSAEVTAVQNLILKAWYMGDDGNDSRRVEGPGEYNWGVGASYAFTPEVVLAGGYSYADGAGAVGDAQHAEVELRWSPVPGLTIIPDVVWTDGPATGGRTIGDGVQYGLRVIRSF